MIIFDGKAEAKKRKEALKKTINKIPQLHLFALVFQEDESSIIYTKLKKKDAEELGIQYTSELISIHTPIEKIISMIDKVGKDVEVQGIIIQKPTKQMMPSQKWWDTLVSHIPAKKDIDGLCKGSLVLPATAKAIIEILTLALDSAQKRLKDLNVVVLGRSDIVGKPVYETLKDKVKDIYLFGSTDAWEYILEKMGEADVVIAATGKANIVDVTMLKRDVIVIDAGSPKPEVNPEGIEGVASFLSPVPGGVGPMTRICLLENAAHLISQI